MTNRFENATAAITACEENLPERDMDGTAFNAKPSFDAICREHGYEDYAAYVCEAQERAHRQEQEDLAFIDDLGDRLRLRAYDMDYARSMLNEYPLDHIVKLMREWAANTWDAVPTSVTEDECGECGGRLDTYIGHGGRIIWRCEDCGAEDDAALGPVRVA